jgi:hypothetical protein
MSRTPPGGSQDGPRPAAGDHDFAGRVGAGAADHRERRPAVLAEVAEQTGVKFPVLIGRMIELPRRR